MSGNQSLKGAPSAGGDPDVTTPETVAPPLSGKPSKGAERRKLAGMVLGPLLLVIVAWYGYDWLTVGRYIEATDDAYVDADITTLAAKVSGHVMAVDAADNATVRAGDVIARIDDGDYLLAAQIAEDNIATQQAAIARIGKQITAQGAAIEQVKAQLVSAQAGATRAELELKRQKDLSTRDFASRQALEQAQAANDQAAAAVVSARAAVTAAEATADVLRAQQREAAGGLKQLQTALEKAHRDLSFTVIRAPFEGAIGNRSVQTGDFVQPGQRLATLVPLGAIYIDANFKETQTGVIRSGQPVEIRVDAVSDRTFKGEVVSLAPASGAMFSLLPPDNATGNFTKVVQRIPVRIRVDLTPDDRGLLRPGMSVVVRVNTKEGSGAVAAR